MIPVASVSKQVSAKPDVFTGPPLYLGERQGPGQIWRPLSPGKSRQKSSRLHLALLSAGVLSLPLFNQAGLAAETNSVAGAVPASAQGQTAPANSGTAITPAEAQELQAEIRELREEVKALKGTTTTNSTTLEQVSEKLKNSATHGEVDALRDLEEEDVLRSVGGSSANGGYLVGGGYSHLLTLTGSLGLGYTALLGPNDKNPSQAAANTTQESFKLSSISLGLTGYARQDTGSEGDVKYNLGVLGTPVRYIGTGATTLANANATPTAAVNGSYLSASDVWVSYDVKTTKLELEPAWTLSLQLGQFLTPYGVDNISTENNRPTINQAQYVSALGFGRDIGLEATGGFDHRNDPSSTTIPLIGYTAGVFNGSGPNTFDNKNTVDALVRLVYNPFYQYSGNFRNLAFAANILEGNLGGDHDTDPTKRRYGGDIQWLRKPFLLTAEYAHSDDGYNGYKYSPLGKDPLINSANSNAYPTPTAAFAHSDSYVTTLFWTPATLPDWQPWVRVDYLKPDAYKDYTSKSTTTLATQNGNGQGDIARTGYSIGFNWFIWQLNPVTRRQYTTMNTERVLKFQMDYTRWYAPGADANIAKNQIDALLSVTF